MTILLLLIPISLLLLCVAVWFLVWGVRSGQYDDLDSPGHRILFEDDAHMIPKDARTPEQEKKLAARAQHTAPKTTELKTTDYNTTEQKPTDE